MKIFPELFLKTSSPVNMISSGRNYFILFLLTAFLVSCQKEIGELPESTIQPNVSEFINYKFDGANTDVNSPDTSGSNWINETRAGLLPSPPSAPNMAYHIIGVRNTSLNKQFNFVYNAPVGQFTPGNYPLVSIGHNGTSTSPVNGSVTFTQVATAIGDFYQGNMSGQYNNYPGPVSHNVSATFRLKRIK
jgi:hypothetical protein